MATVIFQLRKPKERTPQPIYLIFRYKKEKLLYGIGLKCLPQYWNEETYRVRNVIQVKDKDKINNLLNELQTVVEREYTELLATKQPVTKAGLKLALDKYMNRAASADNTLFGFIETYIAKSATRINPNTGQSINQSTIQKYSVTFETLKRFAAQYSRKVDFNTIDLDFYGDYSEYLQQALNLATNTIGKNIQIIKGFLNAATERGINTKLDYKSSRFKVVSEESDNVYLTENELQRIYALDLSGNGRLEKVRDLFIVGCWTGLRFSDFTNIKPTNIRGEEIVITQQKTGAKVVIPIHQTVKAIMNKYGGQLPKGIANQKMNEYLKEVMQAAGIDETVSKSITKGGFKRTANYKKYELISTHTARRSFSTNLFKSGFPAISIMKITGHKTEKAFLKYIKITQQENADLLKMHWQKTSMLKAV
ncbi:MAG: phage integrase SAM-like domain-containing protein [Bacteroidota bacterium]